jgi:hypothetical protein
MTEAITMDNMTAIANTVETFMFMTVMADVRIAQKYITRPHTANMVMTAEEIDTIMSIHAIATIADITGTALLYESEHQ